jgi:hypothetical protein
MFVVKTLQHYKKNFLKDKVKHIFKLQDFLDPEAEGILSLG